MIRSFLGKIVLFGFKILQSDKNKEIGCKNRYQERKKRKDNKCDPSV